MKKRIACLFLFILIIMLSLVIRIGWLQYSDGERLRKEAIRQQMRDNTINPKRGAILDRNGIKLAVSIPVETVSASPNQIAKAGKASEIASVLSQTLELSYEEIYKKIKQESEYVIIKRRVEKSKADEVREQKLDGVYLEVVLVVLDEPKGKEYSGGIIAAPVVKSIINDVLSYMNVAPKYTEQELLTMNIEVPDVSNLSVEQAKKQLESMNLLYNVEGNGNKIIQQIPKVGSKLLQKSTVVLYTDASKHIANIEVPDLLGKSIIDIQKILKDAGLNLAVENSDFLGTQNNSVEIVEAVKQEPLQNTLVEKGSVISVEFRQTEVD